MLINGGIKAHLRVESFMKILITDPDFLITRRDSHIICHRIPAGFTWLKETGDDFKGWSGS